MFHHDGSLVRRRREGGELPTSSRRRRLHQWSHCLTCGARLEEGTLGFEPSYTSPIWDNYDPSHSSYVENRASAYGRYYPLERWDEYGCGYEASSRSSIPGWRRALQDPNLAAIGLVVGAVATYLLARAIPTSFRRKRKRNIELGNVGDQFWSGKRAMRRI
mgnify:CR=1 FL=1